MWDWIIRHILPWGGVGFAKVLAIFKPKNNSNNIIIAKKTKTDKKKKVK